MSVISGLDFSFAVTVIFFGEVSVVWVSGLTESKPDSLMLTPVKEVIDHVMSVTASPESGSFAVSSMLSPCLIPVLLSGTVIWMELITDGEEDGVEEGSKVGGATDGRGVEVPKGADVLAEGEPDEDAPGVVLLDGVALPVVSKFFSSTVTRQDALAPCPSAATAVTDVTPAFFAVTRPELLTDTMLLFSEIHRIFLFVGFLGDVILAVSFAEFMLFPKERERVS